MSGMLIPVNIQLMLLLVLKEMCFLRCLEFPVK